MTLGNNPFATLIGADILHAGDGTAKVQLTVQPTHLNALGAAHGGIIHGLADLAFELASNSHGIPAVAVHSNMQYYHAATTGDLLEATAEEMHLGRSVATYLISVRRGEQLVATFTGTVFRKQPRT